MNNMSDFCKKKVLINLQDIFSLVIIKSFLIWKNVHFRGFSPYIKVTECLSVSKDHANRWTDMVLPYNVASYRSRVSLAVSILHKNNKKSVCNEANDFPNPYSSQCFL